MKIGKIFTTAACGLVSIMACANAQESACKCFTAENAACICGGACKCPKCAQAPADGAKWTERESLFLQPAADKYAADSGFTPSLRGRAKLGETFPEATTSAACSTLSSLSA